MPRGFDGVLERGFGAAARGHGHGAPEGDFSGRGGAGEPREEGRSHASGAGRVRGGRGALSFGISGIVFPKLLKTFVFSCIK